MQPSRRSTGPGRTPWAPVPVSTDLVGVEWRACRVQLLAMLGRRDEARALATETLRVAEALGDSRALAAAHLASSRTSTGARKEAHLEEALRAAIRTGDVVTAALVQVNRSHLLLATARYAEAVVAAREALRLAEMSCPTGRLSTALHNLGEALGFTGEYDEARWQLQRAVGHSRRLGPGRTASGLYGIAEIHRQLGHDAQAAAAYDEAIGLARTSGELQVLVPALAGLARLQVRRDEDAAAANAAEAEELATPALLPLALVASGWVALGRGERKEAARTARRAAEAAGSVQAFDLLAEALELVGVTDDDPATSATRSARRCPSGATAGPRLRQPGSSCCSAGSRAPTGSLAPGLVKPLDCSSGWASSASTDVRSPSSTRQPRCGSRCSAGSRSASAASGCPYRRGGRDRRARW